MKATLSFLISIVFFFLATKDSYAEVENWSHSVKVFILDSVKNDAKVDSFIELTKIITDKTPTKTDPNNIVKVNLTSLALRNFSFQYERVLTRKISGALGIRVMPNGNLPLKSLAKDIVNDDEAWSHFEQLKTSNFAVTPEIRFYMGKNSPRGFYIAPFARYANYTVDLSLEFEVESGNPIDPTIMETIPLNGEASSFSGGVLFGAQWKVAESFYLDWWILGPHYGSTSGNITGKRALNQREQDSLREEIGDLEDIPFIDGPPEINANGVRLNIKGPWGGLRAGLSIGYRF